MATTITPISKGDLRLQSNNSNVAVSEETEFRSEKNNIDVPTLRDKVETINDYVDRIDQIIEPIYSREVAKLNAICDEVKKLKEQARNNRTKIDDSKLEILLLDLVLEIGDVMERIEERALDVDIANAFYEENLGKALLFACETKGKSNLSNATLQKAYAKKLVALDEYAYIVKNRIYKRIEARVNAAEKLFYGIKAILGRRL
jgi:hypothetical protein